MDHGTINAQRLSSVACRPQASVDSSENWFVENKVAWLVKASRPKFSNTPDLNEKVAW